MRMLTKQEWQHPNVAKHYRQTDVLKILNAVCMESFQNISVSTLNGRKKLQLLPLADKKTDILKNIIITKSIT